MKRTLIGGVGYRNLRDHSAGLLVIERLMEGAAPDHVVIEDVSYNAIAVVQWLQDQPPGQAFQRVIFVAAVPRGGSREPGSVTAYRWDGVLPDAEEIQRAVADAVTGIINIDNTVIVCGHFGALPDEVVLVEIEPLEHEFGDALSPAVAAALGPACDRVLDLATRGVDRLPVMTLGGTAVSAATE